MLLVEMNENKNEAWGKNGFLLHGWTRNWRQIEIDGEFFFFGFFPPPTTRRHALVSPTPRSPS